VGNVSLIPFFKGGRKIYLIANVATHPDYRRRGIARTLTDAAMGRALEKQAASIWLHVRQENSAAVNLYRELGFQERAVRTNWFASPGTAMPAPGHGRIDIQPRPGQDWSAQREWLQRAYSSELNWYSQQNWDMFQPGLFSSVYRFVADISTQQWSAYRGNTLLGVLACQRMYGRPDCLWAAFPDNAIPEAFTVLLSYARRMLSNSRGAVMEYPAGAADEAIRAAGFSAVRTLVWMEAPGVSK
jgi:hypothetical protein